MADESPPVNRDSIKVNFQTFTPAGIIGMKIMLASLAIFKRGRRFFLLQESIVQEFLELIQINVQFIVGRV